MIQQVVSAGGDLNDFKLDVRFPAQPPQKYSNARLCGVSGRGM